MKKQIKKMAHKVQKEPLKVGEAVIMFDELGREHDAIVKRVVAPDNISVVVVDPDGNTTEVHELGTEATPEHKAHIEK